MVHAALEDKTKAMCQTLLDKAVQNREEAQKAAAEAAAGES